MVILSKPDGVKLLASENMALRQQLMMTRRKLQRGPKGPEKELINLILEMKKLNPRFGARRIAMQIANQFYDIVYWCVRLIKK